MELLERDAQLGQLTQLAREAAGGHGRMVFIGGEAGVGKTALVQRFCAGIGSHAQVSIGACDPLSTPRPLGPLLDIALTIGGELEQAVQEGTARERIFAALLKELAASERTRIVLLEDAHWADEATLDLIRFLARRLALVRAFILVTYRDDEVAFQHPLRVVLGDVATASGVQRMTLPLLSPGAVSELASDSGLDPAELFRLTDGNAFFVTEVLAARTPGVPTTVSDAVLARVARLPEPARRVLEVAAAMGPRVDLGLLEQVSNVDMSSVDACLSAGVLVTDGQLLMFRHELARNTIEGLLAPYRRTELHRRILERLRSSSVPVEQLARVAHHAERAGDRAAVLEFAPAAARHASALGAHREAAAQYARALRWAGDLEARARAVLLEGLSFESYLLDRPEAIEARQAALDIWRALGEREKEGDNLRWLSRTYWMTGRNAQSEEAGRQAIDVLETLRPGLPLAWAYSNQAQLRMLSADYADAIGWAAKAMQLGRQLQAFDLLAHAGTNLGAARLNSNDSQGVEDLESSLGIALAHGFDEHASRALVVLSTASVRMYELDRAEHWLERGLAYTREHDQDSYHAYLLAWRALVLLHRGRWDEALAVADQVEQTPWRSAMSGVVALSVIGRIRARRGQPRAWEALDQALVLADRIGELQRIAPVRAARAEAAWLAGDPARCIAEARPAYELAAQKHDAWLGAELAFWLWRAGDSREVEAGLPQPFALQVAGDWRAAADAWRRLGCVYEQARVLAEADQLSSLQHALEIAERLDAQPLRIAVMARMRRRGVSSVSSAAQPLTAREREVATLVAQGCTNREIGERLVISERTAENHVQRVLNRVGLRSRTQLAAWVVQHGLSTSVE